MQTAKSFIKKHPALLRVTRGCKNILYPEKQLWHVTTFDDVFGLASDWADLLPRDFDCIIGVPRSGLLVANVLASKMNKPLSTTDSFIAGQVWADKYAKGPQKYRKVLLVEDAVNEGRQLKEDVSKLLLHDPSLEVKTGCLITPFTSQMQDFIDYSYVNARNCPSEWHMHSFFLNKRLAVDLDGVLSDEVHGGPLLIPSFEVAAVVSARLESERAQTEKLLQDFGVRYQQLILFPKLAEGRTLRSIAEYKAAAAKKLCVDWFWESDAPAAELIAGLLGKPVYCPSNRLIYSPKSNWFNTLRGKTKC